MELAAGNEGYPEKWRRRSGVLKAQSEHYGVSFRKPNKYFTLPRDSANSGGTSSVYAVGLCKVFRPTD